MNFINKADILERVFRLWGEGRAVKEPFALHPYPKRKLPNFCGVGPFWEGRGYDLQAGKYVENKVWISWFDVLVLNEKRYHQINDMVRAVCDDLGIRSYNLIEEWKRGQHE